MSAMTAMTAAALEIEDDRFAGRKFRLFRGLNPYNIREAYPSRGFSEGSSWHCDVCRGATTSVWHAVGHGQDICTRCHADVPPESAHIVEGVALALPGQGSRLFGLLLSANPKSLATLFPTSPTPGGYWTCTACSNPCPTLNVWFSLEPGASDGICVCTSCGGAAALASAATVIAEREASAAEAAAMAAAEAAAALDETWIPDSHPIRFLRTDDVYKPRRQIREARVATSRRLTDLGLTHEHARRLILRAEVDPEAVQRGATGLSPSASTSASPLLASATMTTASSSSSSSSSPPESPAAADRSAVDTPADPLALFMSAAAAAAAASPPIAARVSSGAGGGSATRPTPEQAIVAAEHGRHVRERFAALERARTALSRTRARGFDSEWVAVDRLSLGALPMGVGEIRTAIIPPEIPPYARSIQVLVELRTKQRDREGDERWQVATRHPETADVHERRFAQYVYCFASTQAGWSSACTTFWLPITDERLVHIAKEQGLPATSSRFVSTLTITGYRV